MVRHLLCSRSRNETRRTCGHCLGLQQSVPISCLRGRLTSLFHWGFSECSSPCSAQPRRLGCLRVDCELYKERSGRCPPSLRVSKSCAYRSLCSFSLLFVSQLLWKVHLVKHWLRQLLAVWCCAAAAAAVALGLHQQMCTLLSSLSAGSSSPPVCASSLSTTPAGAAANHAAMAAAAVATAIDPDDPLSSSFFNAYRPWLSLYGVRLQRQHKQKQVCLSMIKGWLVVERPRRLSVAHATGAHLIVLCGPPPSSSTFPSANKFRAISPAAGRAVADREDAARGDAAAHL